MEKSGNNQYLSGQNMILIDAAMDKTRLIDAVESMQRIAKEYFYLDVGSLKEYYERNLYIEFEVSSCNRKYIQWYCYSLTYNNTFSKDVSLKVYEISPKNELSVDEYFGNFKIEGVIFWTDKLGKKLTNFEIVSNHVYVYNV